MDTNKDDMQKRFELDIDSSRLDDAQKEYMMRIVDGIFKAPKGRLYIQKYPDFQKYMTFRKRNNDPENEYTYSLVSVMKNPDTGFTEGRIYEFLDILGFAAIAIENRNALESELVNSQNNQRIKEGNENYPEPKIENETPERRLRREIKEAISNMQNVPEYKKQRVYDVLDALDSTSRIKVVDEDSYVEYIAIKSERGVYGYYIVQKMVDVFSGVTQGRRYIPLGTKSLIAYVEEHRNVLDNAVKRHQERLSEK